MELTTITKTEAINLLINKENYLIQSIFKPLEEIKELILDKHTKINNQLNNLNINFRKCIKQQSNALKFSVNDSWLYFNSFKKAYILKDWLILTSDDNTMIYKIK